MKSLHIDSFLPGGKRELRGTFILPGDVVELEFPVDESVVHVFADDTGATIKHGHQTIELGPSQVYPVIGENKVVHVSLSS